MRTFLRSLCESTDITMPLCLDYLLLLAVEAIEDVDQRRGKSAIQGAET